MKQYAESNLKTPLFSDYTPPPYIFEKQVGLLAGRIGLVRGTFFVDSPAATVAPEGVRGRLRAARRAGGRRAPARRALGHRDLRCGDDRGGCAQARRRAAPPISLKSLASTSYDGVLGHYEFDADRQIKPEGFGFLFIRTTPDGRTRGREVAAGALGQCSFKLASTA